jgi:hypothetical protein
VTTDQNGAIAELAVQLAATKLGIDVYHPVAEGGRYDMIFDLAGDLVRFNASGLRATATLWWLGAIERGGTETVSSGAFTRGRKSMRLRCTA